jgi:hypothetical protein
MLYQLSYARKLKERSDYKFSARRALLRAVPAFSLIASLVH